jgi:hypothetical protein
MILITIRGKSCHLYIIASMLLDIEASMRHNPATMRTTLNIDDDLLKAARSIAAARSKSVGTVISELAWKGLRSSARTRRKSGLPTFRVPSDAHPITLEGVKKLEDEV